jgi:hypothetical protein
MTKEIIKENKKNGLKHLVPNFNLWCETFNGHEVDPFIELNGILYWVTKDYSRIIGKVNMNTHKMIEI